MVAVDPCLAELPNWFNSQIMMSYSCGYLSRRDGEYFREGGLNNPARVWVLMKYTSEDDLIFPS